MSIRVEKINENHLKISNLTLINEMTEFPDIQSESLAKIEIDFKYLEALNSVGIRDWIEWLSKFPEKCLIIYKNCPKLFIDIAVMISGVVPANARFESFQVPYYCNDCDDTTTFVTLNNIDNVPPTQICLACQKVAELDVSEKTCKQLQKSWLRE